jgi:hypothetical protein
MNSLYYEREASISDCGKYRWSLTHNWDISMQKPWCGWIMLNPSTADSTIDDPTIRRCVAFSQAWNFGGMRVVNLFSYRATKPEDMRVAADPIGEHGDKSIRALLYGVCPLVICAWGTGGGHLDRDLKVLDILREDVGIKVGCLKLTKAGHPQHPLYVKGDARPLEYSGRPA